MQDHANATSSSGGSKAVWIVLLLVGGLVGFALGRLVPPASQGGGPGTPPIAYPHATASRVAPAAKGEIIRALQIEDPFERMAWLGTELPKFDASVVPQLRYAIQSYVVDKGPAELEMLARRWAREDPKLAFDWALTQTPLSYRAGLVRAVAREWAIQDPQAFYREVSILPPGSTTQRAIESLIAGWLDSGEPGLDKFVYDVGYSTERQLAVTAWLRAVGLRGGPQAIVDLAESVSAEDDRFKRTVMRKAASEMTTLDPSFGVEWEAEHGSGPYGHTLLGLVGTRWVIQDGPAAMEWLSMAEAGPRRDTAVKDAMRLWRQRDRAGMFSWVDEMGMDGVEPWFEPAIGLYVMALSVVDPARSMEWTALIQDEVKQRAARVMVARRWQRADADAAEAWVLASDLTPQEKDAARKPLAIKKTARPYFEKLPPESDDSAGEATQAE